MKRADVTLIQPTRAKPMFRFRLTLADGSKSKRFDCTLGLSEGAARKFAARMQALEDETQAIYRERMSTAAMQMSSAGETVDEWFARFLPTKKCGNSYRRIAGSVWRKWVSPLVGREPIATFTRRHVEDVRDSLDVAVRDGRLSGKSAANVWSNFTSALKAAGNAKDRSLRVREDMALVLANILPPDHGVVAQRAWLYPAEWDRLAACEGVPVEARRLYALALFTGLRPGELRALVWSDVDLAAGVISVSRAWDEELDVAKATKTLAGVRAVPIFPTLLPLLTWMKTRRGAGAYVVEMGDGRHHLAKQFRQHLRVAGVTRSRLHVRTTAEEPVDFRTLRDTYATWGALQHVPITVLQRRLGHEDIATTNGYVKQAEAFDGATIGAPFGTLPAPLTQTGFETSSAKGLGNMVARVGFEPTTFGL